MVWYQYGGHRRTLGILRSFGRLYTSHQRDVTVSADVEESIDHGEIRLMTADGDDGL